MKRLGCILAVFILVLVTAELTARYWLGLGDPPLSVADPDIEYLFKPGDYSRFGNRVFYNSHHMRSPESNQFDVLVFGDSVINGGSLTDQSELATTLLARALGKKVGNVSAGSWGPQNMLAYAKRFGFFGADLVVIVLSSHDAGDVPSFQPIVGVNPNFPSDAPWSALWEGLTRYLPRYLPGASESQETPSDKWGVKQSAIKAVTELVHLARDHDAQVIVALHRDISEIHIEPHAGYHAIEQAAKRAGAHIVHLDVPRDGYRDHVHPNAIGQKAIAEQLEKAVENLPQGTATRETTPSNVAGGSRSLR